ncbi:MAG: arylesterase [Pseudomonadota bacterium]
MKVAFVPVFGAALALAACGDSADTQDATRSAESSEAPVALDPIPIMGEEVRIIAFGDSLFAGYGLKNASGDSYPAKLEAALRARGVNVRMLNAGVSGDTTAAGLGRIEFLLDAQDEKPDLFILELGANDFLRRLPPEETRANLAAMLDILKARDIPVLIMGMLAPPNLGPEYRQAFDSAYPELAEEYGADLIPFWMESIYTKQQMFQSDRLHPTVEGIELLVVSTVDQVAEAVPEPVAD